MSGKSQRSIFVGDRRVRVYTLRRINASFYAKGDNILVELRSPRATLSMSAFGRGRVLRMDGEGTYHLNDGAEEQWSSAPLPLAIIPAPPELPTPPATTPRITAELRL